MTAHRYAYRTGIIATIVASAGLLTACADAAPGSDGQADDSADEESDDGPGQGCDVALDRLDPTAARAMNDADFRALGRARTTTAGVGTRQRNDVLRYVSAAAGDDANDGSES